MWRVKSFDSFDLDDASYQAYIEDTDRAQIMPTIKSVAISRGQYSPTLVGLAREMDKIKVTIKIKAANWRTALKNLSGACPNDEMEHPLVVADETGTEWTVQARSVNLLRTKYDRIYELLLDVPDLMWRKTAVADVWNITASEQTKVINNTGNRAIRPKFKFDQLAIKADGFLYRYWLPIKNPNTTRGFSMKSLDLTDGGLDTRPWVKDPSNYVQIDVVGGINNSQTTIPYDTLTGAMPTYGMGYIDDGTHQEQIGWTWRTGTTSGNLTGITRHIGGTSAWAFADNVKIYLSYCQADMRDVRFYRNALEQNMWIQSPNTASTKLWVVASEPAGIFLTLGTAITLAGTITEIDLQPTVANRTALSNLPASGVVRFGDEAFHFTNPDPIRFTLDVDFRSINDTDPEAHAVGDIGTFVKNNCWLYSGNPFLEAQETDDTRKPILEMATSDNVTRDFASFRDETGLRSDSWTSDVERSSHPAYYKASQVYTGDHMDETADPATEMGMLMRSIYDGKWRWENGIITWSFYEPAGIYRVVSWTYEKYRTGPYFPAWVKLEKSKDGRDWQPVAVVTAPASAGSWGSPATVGPYTMGAGYYYLRVIMAGVQGPGQSGGVGYLSALETNALQYETVNPLVPEIMARHDSSYEHNFIFRNVTNGQYFKVRFTDKLSGIVEVDCEAKTFKTLADNKIHRAAIFVPNTQRDWMRLEPGNNTLKHTELNVTGLRVTVTHEDQLAV